MKIGKWTFGAYEKGAAFTDMQYSLEVERLVRENVRVGWVLNGDMSIASARLMGYTVHDYLISRNIFSKILYKPSCRIQRRADFKKKDIDNILESGINILVLLKIHPGDHLNYLVKQSKKKNIKLVYIFCDNVDFELIEKTDAALIVSDAYYEIIPKKWHHKLRGIFDGYEQSRDLRKTHTDHQKIKLCFVSNNVFDEFPCIKQLPLGVELKIIGPNREILDKHFKNSLVFKRSSFDFEYVEWSIETVYKEILECDVGVIPWDESAVPPWEDTAKFQRLKSVNRAVLFMAMGMPVVASPIPSYMKVVKNAVNSFIAHNESEWREYINFLRDHPQDRARIGEKAREEVLDPYSIEAKGALFCKVFMELLFKK